MPLTSLNTPDALVFFSPMYLKRLLCSPLPRHRYTSRATHDRHLPFLDAGNSHCPRLSSVHWQGTVHPPVCPQNTVRPTAHSQNLVRLSHILCTRRTLDPFGHLPRGHLPRNIPKN